MPFILTGKLLTRISTENSSIFDLQFTGSTLVVPVLSFNQQVGLYQLK